MRNHLPAEKRRMPTNDKPFGMVGIAIFAGYNGLLLLIIGTLLTFTWPAAGPSGLLKLCGIALLVFGVVYWAAIYGFCSHQIWGRKLISLSLAGSIPLNVVAIFPILQNLEMTTGNTILQICSIMMAVASIKYLSQNHSKALYFGNTGTAMPSPEADDERFEDRDDGMFIFDRKGNRGWDRNEGEPD